MSLLYCNLFHNNTSFYYCLPLSVILCVVCLYVVPVSLLIQYATIISFANYGMGPVISNAESLGARIGLQV